MPFARILLLFAVAGSPPAIELSPAPGAPPAASIALAAGALALDAQGRARLPADVDLAAPGLRFYRAGEGAFYLPADHTLVTWPLSGLDRGGEVEVAEKDQASDSWEKSRTFVASAEADDGGWKVRFALAPGVWDLAILVPGHSPAFAREVRTEGQSQTLSAARLARAARLKGRVLDARSGKPPARWSARVRRAGADADGEEARFFATRAIAADLPLLDFASLPPGEWELDVAVPGTGRRAMLLRAPTPGSVVDIGDLYVSRAGRIRVTLAFPSEVPPETFSVSVRRQKSDAERPEIELGRKTAAPRRETVVEFEEIEPGPVRIRGEDASGEVRRTESATARSGETTEVRLTFVPVALHGRVRRGDLPVPGALVRAGVTGRPDKDPSATSDDLGDYSLRFWAARDSVALMTIGPGDTLPVPETVPLEPGATDVEHDILLPAGQIRGLVRDAESGEPIPGAVIHFSSPVASEAPADEGFRYRASDEADREGRFTLRNLRSDPIDVEVTRDGYSPRKFAAVTPTPEGVDLDVRLEKGLRLFGIVTDESGAPVPGATVGVDPDPEGEFFTRTTSTTAAGEFEFRSLAAGPHLLGVLRCGSTIALRRVSLQSATEGSPERREDVALAPELNPIAVHMEDETGRPLANVPGWWVINGVVLPRSDSDRASRRCGQSPTTDADGNLTLRGLPPGTIGAMDVQTRRLLQTFPNDGSQAVWTIRIPRGNNPHDATAPAIR